MSSTLGTYYPGRWPDWQRKKPSEVGMCESQIEEAITFSKEIETDASRDLLLNKKIALEEPCPEVIGPMKERGDVTGVILRHGYVVAEWGEPNRVDMTFSCSKSYLSTVAALALDHGLIHDVHDKVCDYIKDGGFDSAHNSQITWHQLLNQTSDWQGELWGKPDWVDRPEGPKSGWANRKLNTPGTVWKYNDVRVNRLALSLLRLWRKPLPQVLNEFVMRPCGMSPTWEWHGYENAWVKIDGVMMQSVSGGGHWGGGMFISALDHARFGLLCLRKGKWEDTQLISSKWFDMARTPTGTRQCPDAPTHPTQSMPAECQLSYGYMNYRLNTKKLLLPSCPESSYFHSGDGANVIWVDQEHDLVVVVRWIKRDMIDPFLAKVLAALK